LKEFGGSNTFSIQVNPIQALTSFSPHSWAYVPYY